MKRLIRWALLVVALGMLAACGDDDNQTLVRQTVMYGTTLGTAGLGPSDLVILSPTTGAYIRTVGSVGYFVNGLAYDETNGKLYGTTSLNDPVFPSGLIEIDQVTGEGTPIGIGFGQNILLPTVNSDGQMYGWADAGDATIDDLVIIDKVAGTAAVVGDSGLDTFANGLDFDDLGNLVMVNGDGLTYTINTITGGSTPIGDIGVVAHHGKFHPTTGLYWGIDEFDVVTPTRNLLVVDIPTSTVLDSLPTLDFLHAIAFKVKFILVST